MLSRHRKNVAVDFLKKEGYNFFNKLKPNFDLDEKLFQKTINPPISGVMHNVHSS